MAQRLIPYGNANYENTELFGNTYIGNNPTPKHNSCLFLGLNFSGMGAWSENDEDFIKIQFDANILTKLDFFLRHYSDYLEIDTSFISEFNKQFQNIAAEGLKKIINLSASKGYKIFVVIDEYDSLTNALAIFYCHASAEENEYLNILKKGGFFRNFFEALKEGLATAIDRVYITGILPITIADMNSGFNVADWVTFKPELTNMLGITQSELDALLDEIYYDYQVTYPNEQAKEIIKTQYNGYKFSPASEPVYNPMMTLYFLNELMHYNKHPDYLYDNNIRVDYRQIEFIFGNNYEVRNDVITRITDKKEITSSPNLNVFFDMNAYKHGRFINEGLYYLGLLTFSEYPDKFIVPNLVTYDMVISFFERINNYQPDSYTISRIIEAYKTEGDVANFIALFFEKVIKSFPGDFFKNANESFYHGLMYHLLNYTFDKGRFEVYPEFNLPSGTCDLMLHSLPGAKVQAEIKDIFEIKQVPKSATNAQLEAKFSECKQQLAQYKTGKYKDWCGVAVCFRGNKDYKVEVV
ncbi:MAG: AAA family ATPase [Bacteroidia bacterium]|nr:AAA family ATPase [Bacteroidia bacterium]